MGIINIAMGVFEKIVNFYESLGNFIFNFFITDSRLILDVMHNLFNILFYVFLYTTITVTTLFAIIAVYVYFKKTEKELPVTYNQLPFVTIQIPTYNELAALNCARRALDFDYPKNKYEIIIGDDSSEKSISEKIDEFAKKYSQIKVTRRGSNTGFKPENLNHMLKYTKGEYIVIFDSDFLPEKDFLRRIIAPFIYDKKIAAVQSRWVITNFSQNLSSIVGGTIPMFSHYIGLPFLEFINSTGFIAGSAEAIKKKDLVELGGWTTGALTEDIDYSLRLTKAGKKIKYLPNLHCECEAPFTVKDVCRQQMRWAYGVVTAFKNNFLKIAFSKKIPFRKSLNIYILILGYLVTLLFFSLAVLGSISFVTAKPEPINWLKFFSEVGRNILLTSGFLLTSILTLKMDGRTKEIPRMIIGSFTVGIIVIYNVTLGVVKAIFGRPIQWFMLAKKGNTLKM